MNNKIILAFGADELYLQNDQFVNYLNSVNCNSNFDKNILAYLSKNNIQIPYENIDVFNVNPESVLKKNYNNCIQHGEFLNTSKFDQFQDGDVIIFTDGDMNLQRNLNEQELAFLRNFKDGDVWVGYNESKNQTLATEAPRLDPRYLNWMDKFEKNLNEIKCYNTGVLCMNKKTWKTMCGIYINKWDWINETLNHYAKQQFLISYIIGTENFNIIEMDYNIHNHSIYHLPEGSVKESNGLLKYNGEVVLFKHKWF